MVIRGIDDFKSEDKSDKKDYTTYAGGEKSGIALDHPPADRQPSSPSSRGRNFLVNLGGIFRKQPSAEDKGSAGPLIITVYSDGFVIGDGPFRPLNDPRNQDALFKMKAGEAPEELAKYAVNGELAVAMTDKSSMPYPGGASSSPPSSNPATPSVQLFSGAGQSLSASAVASTTATQPINTSAGRVSINSDQPTTEVMFRFHDGTRHRQVFNTSHTVGDVRAYVSRVAPMAGSFVLLSGFPPRPIPTDDGLTLERANLLNESLTQKPL